MERPWHVVIMDAVRTVKKLFEGKAGRSKRRNTRLQWIDDVNSGVKKEDREVFCR